MIPHKSLLATAMLAALTTGASASLTPSSAPTGGYGPDVIITSRAERRMRTEKYRRASKAKARL